MGSTDLDNDTFFESGVDEELAHWQQVEAEAWGATVPDLPEPAAEGTRSGGGSSASVLVFVLVLAVLAGGGFAFYRITGAADAGYDKVLQAPALAREAGKPCKVLSDWEAVQADAFVRLLGEDDIDTRVAVHVESSRAEARVLGKLMEAAPGLTDTVEPIRRRAQRIVNDNAAVQRGEQAPQELLADAESYGPKVSSGLDRLAAYTDERCVRG